MEPIDKNASSSASKSGLPPRVRGVCRDVIQEADREHPADDVLRRRLKDSGLSPDESREAAHVLFSYYRWYGWVDMNLPIPDQLRQARDLAYTFRYKPSGFSDTNLVNRCVPHWIRDVMNVTPEWVRALQSEPTLWLRCKAGKAEELTAKLYDVRNGPLPDSLVYEGKEDLFKRPEFHAGEFEMQDIASQAVSWLCAPKPGETWWDTCAGEGGKMLHLSELMQNKGLIWASDRADWRLKRLKIRTRRAKCFNYRAELWDGGPKLPTKTRFDGVLVDAPCSGLGTWQRNPHARWTTTLTDVRELAAIQLEIMNNTAPSVKPGGKLVYSVCTLTRAETSEVASRFSEAHPEFEPSILPVLPGEKPEARHSAQRWFWPQDWKANGMYVAAWKRKAE
ncbi:MAG TPA: RsmB/NOP family class I SAM-dependent RNA methyltransferase [Roseimicrobium sp.]|nr:RsmB/NOP family class I SAM-dependent RNA methyltransferase [Roseimicrobium sp.]